MHTFKITICICILLGLIIASGIYINYTLRLSSEELEAHIVKIEESSKSGKWLTAEKELDMVKNLWKGMEGKWSVLIDHLEIDNIDGVLVRMEKYIEAQSLPLALAEAATLKQCIGHIPEKEAFNLKNVF